MYKINKLSYKDNPSSETGADPSLDTLIRPHFWQCPTQRYLVCNEWNISRVSHRSIFTHRNKLLFLI